uniref:NADH-ubiquinone oxidoreductase chain 5 n=1 Tax=Aneurus similis TaxID=1176472 RepID=A0A172DYT8_9HEMI|nr:NADH dehydrogenase subunit 5 [Aneurus similis]AFI54681.1 NADH dehydrogenase subunit 5 [Aneurus similis]
MFKVSFLYLVFGLYMFMLGLMFFSLGIYFNLLDYSLFLDWEFLSINSLIVSISFYFDYISLIFMGCVFVISSMVIVYSHEYMMSDVFSVRFLFLVVLFVLSMMMLIISPNLFSILLGWDGLGLVSYCLVVYFQNFKSYNAGMLTVLTNRIGDVAILIALSFGVSSGWHYIYSTFVYPYSGLICWLVILAAFTSSAQIPFSSWLPAAMAAPTPVSALVHSSTLVTAGVYLLIRFSFMFSSMDLTVLILFSGLTMFMAGLGANFEFDLKSIIALSTLSQLGLMMFVLFIGESMLAYYHLLNHAFFKSLLFLCSGLLIHCIGDTQDVRHMGPMMMVPVSCSCFIIATLSLCGMPFLTGFYSKHLIYDYMLVGGVNMLAGVMFLISLLLTVSYSFRLIYYCFSGFSGLFSINSYEESSIMTSPMVFLCFLSVLCGSLLGWVFLPKVLFSFSLWKLMSLLVLFGGLVLGWFISVGDYVFSFYNALVIYFLGSMWFLPSFSTFFFYNFGLIYSGKLDRYMDMGWGESVISNNMFVFIKYVSTLNSYIMLNNMGIFLISLFLIGFLYLI